MTEDAFMAAYDEHADSILRFGIFRLDVPELAEDLVQKTFLAAWEAAQKGTEIQEVKAFLFTIARRQIAQHYRKKKSLSLESLMDKGFDPGDEEKEKWEMSMEAREQLELLKDLEPPSYQEVLWMRYVEDLSVKKIAQVLGAKENSISVRINRAMTKFRKMIKND